MMLIFRRECLWGQDENGVWETTCGYSFESMEPDLLSDHSIEFCCFCGKPILERPYKEEPDA